MRALALCAVVLLTVPAAAEEKPEWKRFSPKDGKCSVEMPGKPVAQPVQELKVGDRVSVTMNSDESAAVKIVGGVKKPTGDKPRGDKEDDEDQ